MTRNKQINSAQIERRLPVWKKLLFSLLTLMTVLGLLEGGLFLLGVKPVAYQEDPYIGFSRQSPLFVTDRDARGNDVLVTAQNKLGFFNRQQFPRKKPLRTTRILCLGGSTTYGHPYADPTSFCGWLRELLPVVDSSRNWELINAGGISYASYRVALVMEEVLRYEPDLFIIYCGHNEFLEQRTYAKIIQQPEYVRGIGGLASHTRVYAAIKNVLRPAAATDGGRTILDGEVNTRLDQVVGPQAYMREDEKLSQILAHFRYNLLRMVDMAQSKGANVLFVVPASNLKDFAPFKNEHVAGLSWEQQRNVQNLLAQARAAYAAQRFTEALALTERVAAIDNRYAELHYLQGRIHDELGAYSDAKAAFERAVDEDVCPLRAISSMRKIVKDLSREPGVAVVDFVGLVENQSPHGIPGNNLFLDHVHPTVDGNRQLALAIVAELIGRGWVNGRVALDAPALNQVTERVTSGIDASAHSEALLNLSKVLGWAGKFEEAGQLARQAGELGARSPEVHYNLGVSLQHAGQQDQALEQFNQAVRLAPDYANAHLALANVLFLRGDMVAASSHAEKALTLDPDQPGAYLGIGQIRLREGQFDDAARYFQEALQRAPESAAAHQGLGKVSLARGNPQIAVEHFGKALRLGSKTASAHLLLGTAHVMAGDDSLAAAEFETAARLAPKNIEALNSLAWLLATSPVAEVRDGPKATAIARRACEVTGRQNPGLLDTLAAAYAEAGAFDQAVATATEAIELLPDHPDLAKEIQDRLRLYQDHAPYRAGH